MKPHVVVAVLAALLLSSVAWAKDELIPTRPKSRERQEEPNPLYDVADDMDSAARRLAEVKTDDTTQDIHKVIVEKLDRLIEMARQQSQAPQSDKSDAQKRQQHQQKQPQPKPLPADQQKKQQEQEKAAAQQQQPAPRPGMGRPGQGDATGPLHTDAEQWGNLPPAIRDQLLQTQGEGFPLKYRELLRRYYRELAKPRE